ncbi:MAG TPA: PA14 domain-containing protein, partial [Candidatus Goldiibacteriota bacterium]|nr:PA14 domain-containing protein [Candidatus Goldiibacteriota bacterium]
SKSIYFARVGEVSVFSKDPNAPSKNPAKGIVENARVVLNMFNHRGDSRQRNSGGQPYEPTIDFTSAILYGIGFLYAVYYSKYYMFFILVMVFFSQAAGSIFSIEAPSAMRAVGTMVPAIFFIAFIFNKILLAFRKAIGKKGEVIYYPLLLAVFLIPIVKDNYNQYFGRWVGGMDELTTATGLYSRKLGSDWRIVMFTNTYFPGHPPFKISRNDKANTASRLTTALTYLKYVENDNFALLFHYDTWQGYDNIKSIYFPESKTEEVTHAYFNKNLKPGEGWGTFARALLVTNEDLKRRRGLMAEYSFGGPKLDNEMPEFKEQDKSKIPYKVIWTGAFMAPYYGRFAFINTGTARVDLVIDGKNIKTGEDVILAEGFHRIRITAYRSSVSDTISMSVRAYGLSAYAFRGSEVLKLDGRYLYNFPIYGLHGYYTNGNKWDTQSKDAEIIDTYMWFDGAIYSPTARWEGTINIPEEGEYLISASANGYVRIVIDGNRYWEQNSGSAQQEAANEYFSGKSMERVSSFKLRKGKHKISVFVMNSTILRLQWAKPGKSADPVPIQMLEPSLDISLK